MTLRFLAHGDSFFSIASGYKVGPSTVFIVIRETAQAIWETLSKIVLKPMNVEDFKIILKQFLDRWNLPHTLGAIDGKHIAIQYLPNTGKYNLPEDKKRNCPQSFCDRDGDDGVVEGEWRKEVGQQFNITLEEIQSSGRGGHKNCYCLPRQINSLFNKSCRGFTRRSKLCEQGQKTLNAIKLTIVNAKATKDMNSSHN
ncbi:hypothetical protein ILUMI_12492 [Ignelater luminosus]|uniref:Nuclease HARBI1 n=1 Tax=Ignelater luminosus TaxID=2038154 RepID=A0A8K0CWD1_IGNLU|nr:hypothetical protein ILUMI_12492 [Ignelater luminosus]